MLNQVTTLITSDKAVANNELRLSICLRSNGFSFSVTTLDQVLLTFGDVDFNLSLPLGEQTQALKDFFASQGISTFGLRQAELIVPSDHFVWIPRHLHDSARNRQYLRMVSNPDSALGAYHLFVSALESYIVFTAPTSVVTAFKLAIPGIDVHCQHSALAAGTMLQRSRLHPIVMMHVRGSKADFAAFYSGQLLLSTTFEAVNDQSRLFHAIDVMKRLHLETPDMELAISGDVGREIFATLQHYFPSVSLYTGRPVTFVNPQFQTLPTYRYALLLS